MNTRSLFSVAITALVCALASAAVPAAAAGRCENPRTTIDQRACHEAAQGPAALRRFVERTRAIYALSYYDFAPEEARAPTRVAQPRQPETRS